MADHRVMAVGEQTSLADRKRRAGQRMIIGFAGPSVDDDLRKLVNRIRPAGFILFARNIESTEQLYELNRELASLVDPAYPAFLSLDQEGGRVQRVREPATVWPPMRTVGRLPGQVAAVSRAMARELRALGFNLNFAPDADVDSNPDNPVIGDRSFGRDPGHVAELVAAFVEAHQAEDVIACAKHFPGHGDTDLDSHLDLPIVEKEDPDLRHIELPPFAAAVRAGVGAVMTSHVLYPAWDESFPSTLSSKIVPRLLREELGYDGVVISDDMEMKAVHGRWPLPTLLEQATRATVDLFLFCKEQDLQIAAFDELVRLQERDKRSEDASTDAADRVHRLRERFFLHAGRRPDLSVVGCAEHKALAERLRFEGGHA